jgi:hypothetical protein
MPVTRNASIVLSGAVPAIVSRTPLEWVDTYRTTHYFGGQRPGELQEECLLRSKRDRGTETLAYRGTSLGEHEHD